MLISSLSLIFVLAAEGEVPMERCSVVLDVSTPSVTYPAVVVDGEPINPYAYIIHGGDHSEQYGKMAAAGVRCYTAGAALGNGPDGFDPGGVGAAFDEILERAPDALIFPRVGVTPPAWWHERNPGNRVVYDDGSEGPQSMFSEAWLRDACRWIEDYARYIRGSRYAKHVMGIHICSGVTAEWQSWGLWEDRRGDFSAPAQRAWRAYLASKYDNDAALTAAWGREARLDDAAIPTRARREAPSELLRDPASWQDVIDFYDFYWRGTANAIERLAAAAKGGGGRDWLVGFFYGYAIMYGGKAQESQHLGMRQLLGCPDIDFFCSPAMYSDRGPGGTSTFMSYTESVQRAGKLWWDEADNRTHLSLGDPFSAVAPARDLFESVGILKREFAHVLSRKAAIWWFDMGGGWYDDPTLLQLHHDMRAFGTDYTPQWEPLVEVAVFIDDKSNYRVPPDAPYLERLRELMAAMPRLGAPYHTYLLSDLPHVRDYSAYIFPNAFDLTIGDLGVIHRLKRDGKILVFMGPYAAGRVDRGRVVAGAGMDEALAGHPRTGDRVTVHASPEWFGAWWLTPDIPMADLRALIREAADAGAAKVHLFHEEDDAFYAGNGIVALHARDGGGKTITFREPVRVREVLAKGGLETSGLTLTFPLQANETRCFAVAPVDE